MKQLLTLLLLFFYTLSNGQLENKTTNFNGLILSQEYTKILNVKNNGYDSGSFIFLKVKVLNTNQSAYKNICITFEQNSNVSINSISKYSNDCIFSNEENKFLWIIPKIDINEEKYIYLSLKVVKGMEGVNVYLK
jgi:hypothetical protein